MKRASKYCWALIANAFLLGTALPAPPPPSAQLEIEYLLSSVENSDCQFYRNGIWFDAKSAAAHLRYKYEHLVAKDLVRDSVDFIDNAATKSSVSGEAYAIKCDGDVVMPTHQWFVQLLVKYRESHGEVRPNTK